MTCIVGVTKAITNGDQKGIEHLMAELEAKKDTETIQALKAAIERTEDKERVIAVKVVMGGDTAGSSNRETSATIDPKVFRRGDFLIGCTTSFRMIDILKDYFKPEEREEGQDPVEYVRKVVVKHIREIFKEQGFEQNASGKNEGGTFLLAYQGILFEHQSDYSLIRTGRAHAAVGSGEPFAEGSLVTSMDVNERSEDEMLCPCTRVELALKAACKNPFVDKPFHIMEQIAVVPEGLVFPYCEANNGDYKIIR